MLKISWNADEIAIRLRGLKLTLADREGAHRIMGEVLLRNTWARFRREVGPDGKKWPPLSPVTLARRRNKRGILRDTGKGLAHSAKNASCGEQVAQTGFQLKAGRLPEARVLSTLILSGEQGVPVINVLADLFPPCLSGRIFR